MMKVLFTNGKYGEIRDSNLGRFLNQGVVAAYKPFDEWVEVRRRGRIQYEGPERRTATLH